jgi:hypothetical protein
MHPVAESCQVATYSSSKLIPKVSQTPGESILWRCLGLGNPLGSSFRVGSAGGLLGLRTLTKDLPDISQNRLSSLDIRLNLSNLTKDNNGIETNEEI